MNADGFLGMGGWTRWGVQSVTWATMVGCPCDWWLVSCSPSYLGVKGWVTLTFDSSPIKETFAKLSGTAIKCLDSQFPKLGFHYGFPPTRE